MCRGESYFTAHDCPQIFGNEIRIRRLAQIEPDRPVRLLPPISMMKMKSRGQFVAAHRFKCVLVDRQHTSAKTGSPDMSVEETDMARRPALGLDHKWCQYNDEMAPGHHEVVCHSQWPRIDQVRLDQLSSGVDAVKQQRRPGPRYKAYIP